MDEPLATHLHGETAGSMTSRHRARLSKTFSDVPRVEVNETPGPGLSLTGPPAIQVMSEHLHARICVVNRETAVEILRGHLDRLRAMGVQSMSLFGSVARDEAGTLSDVDVLVDFQAPATFDAYMDLKLCLEAWLGARVDLVTRKALRPRIRARIEAEAIRVA
jgi:uncharacterized protein